MLHCGPVCAAVGPAISTNLSLLNDNGTVNTMSVV